MQFAYVWVMDTLLEEAINRWHTAVNTADMSLAVSAVSDLIVVLGPRGAGAISNREFAGWILRSGICLKAQSWHPISETLMVVEQDATWPETKGTTKVATLFRIAEGKVSAALRFRDLKAALELAFIYRELSATEQRAVHE